MSETPLPAGTVVVDTADESDSPALHAQLVVFARELGELYSLERQRSRDLQHALTSLEVAIALAAERSWPPVVTQDDIEAALGTKAIRYGRDDHYDVISAFIK